MINKALLEALNNSNKQTTVPVSKLTSDLDIAATVSKLITDPYSRSRRSSRQDIGPDIGMLRGVTSRTASNVRDAKNFLQLLPDMKMGFEILISSVLAPKDMMEPKINYTSKCDLLPINVIGTLNKMIQETIENEYKLTSKLNTMLWEILATHGSYAVAILPENAIDDLINNDKQYSFEDYKEALDEKHYHNLGIIGEGKPADKGKRFSLESFQQQQRSVGAPSQIIAKDIPTHVYVSDNPMNLRRGQLTQFLFEKRQSQLLGTNTALENMLMELNQPDRLEEKLYKDRAVKQRSMVMVKTQNQLQRHSVGKPVFMHIPSASLIPIFTPGEPENHLGYFCVLDETGHPLNEMTGQDYYQQIRSAYTETQASNSSLVQKMTNVMGVNQNKNGYLGDAHIDRMVEFYADMLETDLLDRLGGIFSGKDVKLANKEALWQIMLARSLRQQYTQVLYIPRELLTYMAVDYNEYGIGRSLMEDLKVICSLRVVTTFSNMMASVKNSIGRTQVKIKLDEHDTDPWKTMEIIAAEFNRNHSGLAGVLPVGTSGPQDVVDWLARAGWEFSYEGHPDIPDVQIDTSQANDSYARVDSDLDEDLRKRGLLGISVSPDIVDAAISPEFATVHQSNHIMLAKRVISIQDAWTPQLSDMVRKLIINDGDILNEIKKILAENKQSIINRLINKEEYKDLTKDTEITPEIWNRIVSNALSDYITHFAVDLPRPNSVELTNQLEAIETYEKALTAAVEKIFDSNVLNSDTMGELGDKVDMVKDTVVSALMRSWMAENNFVPEVFEYITADEDGKLHRDLYQDAAHHVTMVSKGVARYLKSLKPTIAANNAFVEQNDVEETENESDSGSDDTENEDTENTEDTGDTGDDFGSEDDFDMDFGDEDTEGDGEGDDTEEPNQE